LHSRRALDLDAGDGHAWTMLGVALRQRDPAEAEAALRRAAVIGPRDPDAHFHLGNLLREQGRAAAAIESYERALALAPDHPSLLNNYALALDAAGAGGRAQAVYRRILEARSDHRQALRNLAHSLCSARRFGEAAAHCAHYLKLHPEGDARVWIDQGICQHACGDDLAAEASFRRALAIAPGDAVAQTNLASVLIDRGDFAAAEAPLSGAVADDPDFLYAAALLAYCRQHLCSWDGLATLHARVVRGIEQDESMVNAFAALSVPMSAANQLRAARRWAQSLAPPEPAVAPAPRSRVPALRLGYVSSDFRTHAVAFLATEVWERHDRARFETSAYSIAPPEDSPLGHRVAAAFSRFVDCSAETPDDTAQRIRDDGIDILIDLNGYTTHARSEIFALRPAPVQVNWLGYLGTLGAAWYDYVITDGFATPGDQQAFFTERFLTMPHCCAPSDTRRVAAAVPSREACGLPAQGFVFCCFNTPYKILPPMFDVWMRLLREVPGSVLWLSPGYPIACANLRREAVARGVDPRRLIFAPRVELAEHLARHAHADLFVDTLPYNAGTTANDALFMGVPVLTCSGETMASRIAGSQLHAIGLPELVTGSLAEYEALALRLARAPETLAALRAKLAANRHTHPLFDMARYTQDFEALLLHTWDERHRL
jgi:predicted O-linked N-acetylglucosamine transferase (SPINDLY family)